MGCSEVQELQKRYKEASMMNRELQSILRSFPALSYGSPIKAGTQADESRKKRRLKGGQNGNGLKALAEAIILQSMEDLWTKSYRKESLQFFLGEGFRECADIAGMKVIDRLKVVKMAREMKVRLTGTKHASKLNQISI